jgi:FkbM family methyltransferase
MMHAYRPMPFVLVSSDHGTLIVNRNDYNADIPGQEYGAGHRLLNFGSLETLDETATFSQILHIRRKHFGDGVVVIDGGANIGVYTLELARILNGWGHVYAFEAQEKIFYALAGNVIMNNFLNVTARFNALGSAVGTIKIPELNYNAPGSFGSFELKKTAREQDVGQTIDYTKATAEVPMITIDSLQLPRVDFIKIDVEGMEVDVLEGAAETIKRCRPMLFVEILKSDPEKIAAMFRAHDYKMIQAGINVFAFHSSDPVLSDLNLRSAN